MADDDRTDSSSDDSNWPHDDAVSEHLDWERDLPSDDDTTSRHGIPHPLDRVWRHPSEVGPRPTRRASAPERLTRSVRNAARWAVRRFALAPTEHGQRPPTRPRSRLVLALGSAGAGAAVTLALLGVFGSIRLDRPAARSERGSVVSEQPADIIGRLAPSIVAVTASDFNGSRRGSGVALRHRGEVLTNARTIGNSATATVLTIDGQRVTATVVGVDPAADLALLDLDQPINAARIGTGGAGVGEAVFAIGADPSGHAAPWVTRGIIASTDGLISQTPGPEMAGLLVTDALVDRNAAGGALVNAKGEVLGILLAPIEGHREAHAIPMTYAGEVARRLRNHGRADHGWLGLNGVDAPQGPIVGEVAPRGPASRSGVQFGDVIEVRVRRGDNLMTMTIAIGATPSDASGRSAPG